MNRIYDINHVRSCIKHVRTRAAERCDLELSEYDVCEIALIICNGGGKLKAVFESGRYLYKVPYRGRQLAIVWDSHLIIPATLLPHDTLKQFSQKNFLLRKLKKAA